MAVESITINLTNGADEVAGKDYVSGDLDDNQIVTLHDSGFEGGTILFEYWGKDSPTEAGAGPGGDDVFRIDLSEFDEDFDINVKSLDEGDVFRISGFNTHSVEGNVHTFTYTGEDGNDYTLTIDAESTNGTGVVQVLCFARGTMIRTDAGERPIEELREGDHVICCEGRPRPIRWIGSRLIAETELRANPWLRPVRFETGALGPGLPSQPLTLSPQHRVLLRDWRAELLFGEFEVLAPAKSLINDRSILRVQDKQEVEYFHILLDSHDVIFANGVECETLMPAELLSSALAPEARQEILHVLPELAADFAHYGPTRHRTLRPHEVAVLTG